MAYKVDLNKLDKLYAKASKGPWGVWKEHASVHNNIIENTPSLMRQAKNGVTVAECDEGGDYEPTRQARANAKFIAVMKNVYPDMAAEIRNLRAEVARLQFVQTELEALAAMEGERDES